MIYLLHFCRVRCLVRCGCLLALLVLPLCAARAQEVVRLSGSIANVGSDAVTIRHGKHSDPVHVTARTRFHYGIADAQFEELLPGDLAYVKTIRTPQGLEAQDIRFIGKRKKVAAAAKTPLTGHSMLAFNANSR